jgi:hypothetical protein
VIDFSEIGSGETWEFFTRDFLSELGLSIESSPDRGADLGKDLLVQEEVRGPLVHNSFRWLVSCKHNALSGSAVSEADEPNILERIDSFGADGFLGVYSTVPTANLNARLRSLREQGRVKDYRLFDHKLIENYLIRVGYSHLVMRYLPESYKLLRPLHAIVGDYQPLSCAICEKDLLEGLYSDTYGGVIVFAHSLDASEEGPIDVIDVQWVCKQPCDSILSERLLERRQVTGWEDIGDLVIPAYYLQYWFSTVNSIYRGKRVFTPKAYENLKHFMYCLGQKVFRETTPNEYDRLHTLDTIDFLRM